MVDSMSTWSSLEITRNPFDSGREERTNCPGFSPSMFCEQETPGSQKKGRSFRWSIEQISRLNPADIDEFPIQEYGSTFEREEDEIAAQKAVDEYFSQSSIVPSPWTPTTSNHGAKHVKFSPLPPATAYIEAESSVESSYLSPNSTNCKTKADASSQTRLSLPPEFDLKSHLGPTYYNQDGLNGSNDISLSSLRRKLFTQVENKNAAEKDQLEIKSILKSPKSPVLIDSMLQIWVYSEIYHRKRQTVITSSPVSDQSTPRHILKNRHSTASTMSSPNISPIKPLLSVPETPTSTRRPYLSRQSLSPMECSTNVLESSGIEIIGDAFPDLSPIKANSRTGRSHVQEMDLETEAEHVENRNTSLDDGGPLEVSALSVKDDNEGEEKEVDDFDNDDDKVPPKITMEDLADDSDSTEEKGSAHSADLPQIKFEPLTPGIEPVPDENAASEAMDTGNVRSESTSTEQPELPKESSMQVEDVGSNFSQEPKIYDQRNERQGLRKDNPSGHPAAFNRRNWQTKNYHTTESFHKFSHLNDLDEEVIMMRAKAALRRANRFSPTQGVSSYSYDPHSLTLSDLSLNASSAWEPVRMSTPLAPHPSTSSNYRNHRDHDSLYGYKSVSRSHRHDSAGITYSEESGLGRSGGDMPSHYLHRFSGRRLSPAVEDIIQRRKVQGGFEGWYPLSTSRKKSSSPLFSSKYDEKWQLSRTHPMSYVEWKALYWRPPRDHFMWRDHQYQRNQYGYDSDFKRSSWPPRPVSSKLMYGSRPLSPPVTFPPAKIPRAVPGGYVSKMALPSYQENGDSGYSDWMQGASQWEDTVRSQHNLMGYAGEFRYY